MTTPGRQASALDVSWALISCVGLVMQYPRHRNALSVLHPRAVKDDLRPAAETPHRKCRQALPPQHRRPGRHGPGPGQFPQQRNKRGQVTRRNLLPQLNPGIPAPPVPAAAQRHPRDGQAGSRPLDHGDAIAGIPRLSCPGLNHEIEQPAIPGHPQLQPAANAHHGNPAIAGTKSAEVFSPLNRPLHSQPPVRPRKLPRPDNRLYQPPIHKLKLSLDPPREF
jgi:hypothetical protein